MIEIETILQQRPELFDNLAARWHASTGGELVLLSPRGDIIKSYNGNTATPAEVVTISNEGDVTLKANTGAIMTPMVVHGELRGHLLSYRSTIEQLPLLAWAAETLMDHLNSEQALQGMTDELIVAWDQLELVYRITQTLGEHSDLLKVLHSMLDEIIQVVTVEAAFIIFDHQGQFQCVTAGAETSSEAIYNRRLLDRLANLDRLELCNSRALALEFWPDAPKIVSNFIGAPISTNRKIQAALGLVNNTKNGGRRDFTAGHAKLITSVSEQIGPIFDYFCLQDELIAQERVRHELEIAAEIQENMLSTSTPQVKGLTVDFSTLPAYEVGGDFYDFISTSDNQLTVVVGDVAGKGIPAAMFTSMIRTMLRVEALHNQEPHQIIKRVNDVLWQDLGRAELFVTSFVATFDTKANVLMYANAGHMPGIIYHSQANTSRLLKATALPIGVFNSDYKVNKTTQYVHISDGDTLVVFSDGISEAKDPQGQIYGLQRIRNLVHQHGHASPQDLKQIILDDLTDFSQSDIRSDDVSLVVIKFSLEEIKTRRLKPYQVLASMPFKYMADTIHLGDISEEVTKACRSLENLPRDSRGDDFVYLVELAVSEIFTNIIEHAYAEKSGYISGKITLTSIGVEIDVYDQGQGFNPNDIPPPMSDPMDPSEGGYGLHIVRQIMDVAKYAVDTPIGNHWKLIKYLPE